MPVTWFGIVEAPRSAAPADAGGRGRRAPAVAAEGMSVRAALATRSFWALFFAYLCTPLAVFPVVTHQVAVAGAPGGSWGVPRPSVADYVTGTGAGPGRPPPEGANVVYALVPPAQLSGGSSSEGVPSPRGRAKPMTGGDFNSRRARGIPRAPRPRLGAGRR
jgi:hypothetical protein